jgi:hypothetical protein
VPILAADWADPLLMINNNVEQNVIKYEAYVTHLSSINTFVATSTDITHDGKEIKEKDCENSERKFTTSKYLCKNLDITINVYFLNTKSFVMSFT